MSPTTVNPTLLAAAIASLRDIIDETDDDHHARMTRTREMMGECERAVGNHPRARELLRQIRFGEPSAAIGIAEQILGSIQPERVPDPDPATAADSSTP